jgi:broad specificity phosphatase PhoE
MSGTTKLYLIRHAEVEAGFHRVYGGKIDMGLSATGHDQARRLAGYLRQIKLAAVYASPMRRVRETMAPLNGHGPGAPVFMEALREVDFGDWTGLNFQQIRERFQAEPWDWLDWLEQGRMPNAENAAQIRARLEPCLRQILTTHSGQPVAIFAHGGVIRGLLAILLELPLPKMRCFDIEYAGVTEVDLVPGRGVEIQSLNYIPWKFPA